MWKPGHCEETKQGIFIIFKIFLISINNYINKFDIFYNTKIIYVIIYAQLKKRAKKYENSEMLRTQSNILDEVFWENNYRWLSTVKYFCKKLYIKY